jgi:hypothetical protein
MSNPNNPVFPYAASTDSTLSVASDNAQTTLNGGINSSVTTIPVASVSLFTTPCIFVIDGEIIQAASVSGNSFTGCIRGFAGSSATTHTDTTPVYGYIVAYLHNQITAEVNSISSLLFNSDFSGLKKNENLLILSEAFETGATWNLSSGATISGTTGTDPTGGSTARTLLEGSSLGLNSVSSTFSSPVIGNTYTFSVYAKYTNNQWLTIGQDIANETARRVSFDIQNGLVGIQGASATGAIVSVGNGWYRCLVQTTCTNNADKSFDIVLSNANNVVSYVGASTQSVYIWGAQVRSGGFDGPLSYISTDGSIVSLINGGDLVLDYGDLT